MLNVPSPPAEDNCYTMSAVRPLLVASILSLILDATMGDLASKYNEHSYQFETSLRLVSTCTCVLLASLPGHYKSGSDLETRL